MGTVIALKTFFGLHPARWRTISAEMFFVGGFTVFGASVVLAFNRFGGLLFNSPQQFVQMLLYGIWGWLFLGTGIWAAGRIVVARVGSNADQPTLLKALTSVGFAHRPVLVLGAVLFISTGLLQVNGPGLVVAVIALGVWFPTLLALSVQHSRYIELRDACVVVAVPYALWLAIIGRHLISQVAHLL